MTPDDPRYEKLRLAFEAWRLRPDDAENATVVVRSLEEIAAGLDFPREIREEALAVVAEEVFLLVRDGAIREPLVRPWGWLRRRVHWRCLDITRRRKRPPEKSPRVRERPPREPPSSPFEDRDNVALLGRVLEIAVALRVERYQDDLRETWALVRDWHAAGGTLLEHVVAGLAPDERGDERAERRAYDRATRRLSRLRAELVAAAHEMQTWSGGGLSEDELKTVLSLVPALGRCQLGPRRSSPDMGMDS